LKSHRITIYRSPVNELELEQVSAQCVYFDERPGSCQGTSGV